MWSDKLYRILQLVRGRVCFPALKAPGPAFLQCPSECWGKFYSARRHKQVLGQAAAKTWDVSLAFGGNRTLLLWGHRLRCGSWWQHWPVSHHTTRWHHQLFRSVRSSLSLRLHQIPTPQTQIRDFVLAHPTSTPLTNCRSTWRSLSYWSKTTGSLRHKATRMTFLCPHLSFSFSSISLPLSCSSSWYTGSQSIWGLIKSDVRRHMPYVWIIVPGRGHLGHGLPSSRPAWHQNGNHLRLAPHPGEPEWPLKRLFCFGLTPTWGPAVPDKVLLALKPAQDCVALDLCSSQASSLSWILCCYTCDSLRLASLQETLGY